MKSPKMFATIGFVSLTAGLCFQPDEATANPYDYTWVNPCETCACLPNGTDCMNIEDEATPTNAPCPAEKAHADDLWIQAQTPETLCREAKYWVPFYTL